ncbi:MAG: Ig-like domain-containing protein [Verrucomicrobia bacterium]|nr:Ig-like domain-containing protein [Verrucomicrobiota bacterium]
MKRPFRFATSSLIWPLIAVISTGAPSVWADHIDHKISAGLLSMSQIPGWGNAYLGNPAMDDNTNCVVTLGLSINDFRIGSYNRADYNVQTGAIAANQYSKGVLMACVTQNGRTNAAADSLPGETTNAYPIATMTTNIDGSYRICSWAVQAAGTAGSAVEYNVNVAGAFFPYTNYWGGYARNRTGANGSSTVTNDTLAASPGLVYGVNYVELGGGRCIVDLTDKGIDSRTDGVLLVTGAKDENNFALSQVNVTNGTWNLFLHDESTGTAGNYEQDPIAFVFIPKYATNLISGRVNGDGTIDAFSGDSPQFSVDLIGTGTYLLQINSRPPTNGVLIISCEGGGYYNLDNIVSYQATADGTGWIVQSRDTPSMGLQTVNDGSGNNEPVFDFVYIPAPLPGITVTPTNGLLTTQSGGAASFTVVLDLPPTANVTINVSSSDTNEGTVDRSLLIFTPNNWNVPQTVTITGQHDSAPDGSIPYRIVLAPAASADARYNGVDPDDVSVVNINNLQPGIAASPTSFTTTDTGGAATLSVWLSRQPAANVLLPVASSNTNAGTVSPASLTFTPANYATPQTVTVIGALDRLAEGNVAYVISIGPAASADPGYNGLANAPVVFGVNLDTDMPAAPAVVSPTNNAINVSNSPALQVKVSEPGDGNLTVTFYGRQAPNLGGDFMIAVMPDSQYYSANMNGGTTAMLTSQTDWIVSHRVASNIVYAAQLGDIVNYGDTNHSGTPDYHSEWLNATNALYRLENPLTTGLPYGIPYGAVVGNHDQSPNGDPTGTTTFYNQFFGVAHFAGRPYYGGHYGTTNNDHFDLFSASGLDFIALYFEYDPSADPSKLSWGNSLLQTYSSRHAIVFCHNLGSASTPSTSSAQGGAIYSALRANTNLFLMCAGHVSGEGSRTDVYQGRPVYTLVSDYQSYTNGGSGYMRLYQFSPDSNVLRVFTYSPYLDKYETDANSQFTLPLPFSIPSPVSTNFVALGTNTVGPSGGIATVRWPGLALNTQYQWYTTASDSLGRTTTSSLWQFTTKGVNTPPTVSNRLVNVYGDSYATLALTGYDADGDTLTLRTNTLPAHGLLQSFVPATGAFTYCPARGYRGLDRFTFSASDGQASSATATMNLNVIFPLDANADGLPDAWEAAYGITDPNADSDGDGQANWQEYYAGTNPTNAASVFRILSLSVNSNGSRVLTWASTGGTRYRVQFADADPNQGLPGTFTDVTRLISDEMDPGPEGAPSTQAFTDDFNQTGGAPPNSARYYRVQVIR